VKRRGKKIRNYTKRKTAAPGNEAFKLSLSFVRVRAHTNYPQIPSRTALITTVP